MKKSRYSEAQIVSVLKEAESGVPVSELCRTHGMSSAAFYQWRSKYGGMDASLISEMKQLQAENARLKRMYADIAMQCKASTTLSGSDNHFGRFFEPL